MSNNEKKVLPLSLIPKDEVSEGKDSTKYCSFTVDMPEPLGKPVQMTTFADRDHVGDKVTRLSRTGVLMFLNRARIIWFSKKQNSIETSSFGSQFTAMKQGVEISEGSRYKLRMMGVPLDGPTHIKADNMSLIKTSSLPESMLKKKSNSIAYPC
jgi:hypothetical protein